MFKRDEWRVKRVGEKFANYHWFLREAAICIASELRWEDYYVFPGIRTGITVGGPGPLTVRVYFECTNGGMTCRFFADKREINDRNRRLYDRVFKVLRDLASVRDYNSPVYLP